MSVGLKVQGYRKGVGEVAAVKAGLRVAQPLGGPRVVEALFLLARLFSLLLSYG